MGNYEKDLDVIASRIKNVSDLLKTFLAFCEEEENTSGFLLRFETQKSLIESALFTVDFEYNMISSLLDEELKEGAA